ncbi:aspartate--tRNA mitochondrial isoform X1 [Brachionus plicatilis]|uniref:Aspartate--tRNA mitochondrial isoform X1 n=1 Tax=Brachionus plicatilis TaxID=10195 RepID=A0A3M7T2I7_BRAPC|nr:aspartate--tRNA mitochondrial isoform X1 [Brachionus plicatilis]
MHLYRCLGNYLKLCINKNLTLNRYLSSQVSSGEKTAVNFQQSTSFSKNLSRTHYCGQLDVNLEGQNVSLCGWVQKTRFQSFLVLRDVKGIVQVVFEESFLKNDCNRKLVENLNQESVLSIKGTVRRRPKGQENCQMKTGSVEVVCDSMEILNECRPKLPFEISDFNRPNELARLKYRYLDLRFAELQQNLILRSNFVHQVRQFLNQNNFIEIETPTLFRRTPGGAREFIVPTNKPGQFYCLTQSPQQFKQLLMVSGFDRYYQVAKCYRDETFKPDRQPEFTQIDMEMSFVTDEDIIHLIENLVHSCWPLEQKPLIPFNRMKFQEAMDSYGADKPDVRFALKINSISHLLTKENASGINRIDNLLEKDGFNVQVIKIPKENGVLSVKEIEKIYKQIFEGTNFVDPRVKDSFTFVAKKNGECSSMAKFLSSNFSNQLSKEMSIEQDDTWVLLCSCSRNKSLEIMGKVRLNLADKIDEKNVESFGNKAVLLRDPKIFNFVWVVDFPLFTWNEESNQWKSTHHPFTAPITEHLDLVKESRDLESLIGLHYDLVLNGNEVAGGSIRIHNSDLQRHILENILKEETSKLNHLIEALSYGAPPHGGIAIGLDRLMAVLCGTHNIRNVIAFPKNQAGRDLMSSAPSNVPQEELDYYNLICKNTE